MVFKNGMGVFPRTVVLQFNFLFFIFDVFYSKITSQKIHFLPKKLASENSPLKSQNGP